MSHLSNVCIKSLGKSIFVKPMEVHYTLNGAERKWDYIEVHDSVVIIIFNITRKVFVCVEQFRPAIYVHNIPCDERGGTVDSQKYPVESGMSLEFCAGIIDKRLSYEEIAKAEVMEETGYDISIETLEKIQAYRSNVGVSAGVNQMYYVEVEDHMKTGKGGGLEKEGEFIDIVEISIPEARKIYKGQNSAIQSVGFLFGLSWFFQFKAPQFNIL